LRFSIHRRRLIWMALGDELFARSARQVEKQKLFLIRQR
jgi:hypothetical protein